MHVVVKKHSKSFELSLSTSMLQLVVIVYACFTIVNVDARPTIIFAR